MTQAENQPTTGAGPVGHAGARVQFTERRAWRVNGWLGVLVLLICIGVCIAITGGGTPGWVTIPIVVAAIVLTSLTIVQPGETKVVRFFGNYVGTVRQPGLWWVAPLSDRKTLSVRVRKGRAIRAGRRPAACCPGPLLGECLTVSPWRRKR